MQSNRMVTGFNHNIKHGGQLFHVQTEDSGVDNPHIITHLFLGGNILASKKTSYADILSAANLREVVRTMMEEQHKEMLRGLIGGAYDEVIERYRVRAWQPGRVDVAAQAAAAGNGSPAAADAQGTPAPSSAAAPAGADAGSAGLPAQPPPSTGSPSLPGPESVADNIFGEDLISERSLDDVILSYLAEDSGES